MESSQAYRARTVHVSAFSKRLAADGVGEPTHSATSDPEVENGEDMDSYRSDLRASNHQAARGRDRLAMDGEGAGWVADDLEGIYDSIDGGVTAAEDGADGRHFGGAGDGDGEAGADLEVAFEDDAGDGGEVAAAGDGVAISDAQGMQGADSREFEDGEAAFFGVGGEELGAEGDDLAETALDDDTAADLQRRLLDRALSAGQIAPPSAPAVSKSVVDDELSDSAPLRPTKRLRIDALDPLASLRDEVRKLCEPDLLCSKVCGMRFVAHAHQVPVSLLRVQVRAIIVGHGGRVTMKYISGSFKARAQTEGQSFTAQLLSVLKGLTSRVAAVGGNGVEYVLK